MKQIPKPEPSDRADRPSASARERWGACPGSHELEQAAGKGDETEAMKRGTLIHSVMAGETPTDKLTEDEFVIYDQILLNDSEVSSYYEGNDCVLLDEGKELRYWFHGNLFSGQLDKVQLYEKDSKLVVAIIDYKTGVTGPLVKAENNGQLEALMALLNCQVVFSAEWHTWIVHQEGANQAVYEQAAVGEITKQINRELAEIASPKPTRVVGPHCIWCNAKGICPEAVAVAAGMGGLALKPDGTPMAGAHLSLLLDRADLAERVIADMRKAAKEMLGAKPDCIPGWKLTEGGKRRTVVNAEALTGKLDERGVKVKPKITLSIAAVEAAIRKHAKPEQFDGLINGYVKTTDIAPSLRKTERR